MINFSKIKILVVGDFMIDHYIMGTSDRISPEAPVPIVIPKEELSAPGGAGNVAMNLRSLGSQVYCAGIVGDDQWGRKLIKTLKDNGINTSGIKVFKNHQTSVKQRIYSNGVQVARIDTEKIIEKYDEKTLLRNCNQYDLIVLSDYNKGVLNNPKKIISIINSNNSSPKIDIVVDPKKNDFKKYTGANIITPNLIELQKASNCNIDDEESIVSACSFLIDQCNFEYICATRGSKGMIVVGKGGYVKKIQPYIVKDADVTGAGDTAISSLALCYALTKDIELSAKIANAAASIAVSRPGTATVNIEELNKLISL